MQPSQGGPPTRPPVVLAVDPGTSKCGVAVCDPTRILARAIVASPDLPVLVAQWAARYNVTHVVIGDRTGADEVRRRLIEAGVPVSLHAVPEAGTTLRARARYFRDHPPKGWRRWLPQGLRIPPVPYDDYVAVLLAEAFLADRAREDNSGGAGF